jgi:GNAT superfamily N-acetyltransferase
MSGDGHHGVRVRQVVSGDRAALQDFYARLSPQSRYARFMGFTRELSDMGARSMCTLDHVSDEGFVATAVVDGHERIVGHLCVDRTSAESVELGVAVSDEWQGHRIGRRLLERALRWAAAQGYERIVASAFAENWRVLRLLTSAPFGAMVTAAAGGIVEVTIPLRKPAKALTPAA